MTIINRSPIIYGKIRFGGHVKTICDTLTRFIEYRNARFISVCSVFLFFGELCGKWFAFRREQCARPTNYRGETHRNDPLVKWFSLKGKACTGANFGSQRPPIVCRAFRLLAPPVKGNRSAPFGPPTLPVKGNRIGTVRLATPRIVCRARALLAPPGKGTRSAPFESQRPRLFVGLFVCPRRRMKGPDRHRSDRNAPRSFGFFRFGIACVSDFSPVFGRMTDFVEISCIFGGFFCAFPLYKTKFLYYNV